MSDANIDGAGHSEPEGGGATVPASTGSAATSPGMPGWFKAMLIVLGVIAIVLVVSKLLGVEHGPGRHGGLGELGSLALGQPSSGLRAVLFR